MRRIKTFSDFLFESVATGSLTVPVGGTFASGKFEIKNEKLLDEKMPEIIAFLKKYPIKQGMEVKVSAMESQVPNKGVGLKEGDLAQKRTEAMIEYLKEKLKDFTNVTLYPAKPQIGPTPWNPEKGDKADDEKFTKEQRVDIVIKPLGQAIKTTESGKGKETYVFSVPYDAGYSTKDGDKNAGWTGASTGNWGFEVEGKDEANKIFNFISKVGLISNNEFSKGKDEKDSKGNPYKFFGSGKFRTFGRAEDFKEFFNKFGNDIIYIGPMPDYFFKKSDGSENGLRPLWKAGTGTKDRTL